MKLVFAYLSDKEIKKIKFSEKTIKSIVEEEEKENVRLLDGIHHYSSFSIEYKAPIDSFFMVKGLFTQSFNLQNHLILKFPGVKNELLTLKRKLEFENDIYNFSFLPYIKSFQINARKNKMDLEVGLISIGDIKNIKFFDDKDSLISTSMPVYYTGDPRKLRCELVNPVTKKIEIYTIYEHL